MEFWLKMLLLTKLISFIREAKQTFNVEIEHKNRFLNTMIFPQLNRYLAWSGRPDEKPIIKNIDGMSKRSPKWVQKYIEKIAKVLLQIQTVSKF